jgi:hypothetical protein
MILMPYFCNLISHSMILFFGDSSVQVFAVKCNQPLTHPQKEKLSWLFGNQPPLDDNTVNGSFYGPRATMVTPLEHERSGDYSKHGYNRNSAH